MTKRLTALALALALTLCGCAKSSPFTDLSGSNVALFTANASGSVFCAPPAESVQAALEEKDLRVQLYPLGEDAHTAIETALSEECDLFVALLTDDTVAEPLLDAAQKNQLPIIFCGAGPDETQLAAYDKAWQVCASLQKQGELLGEALTEAHRAGAIADRNDDHLLQYLVLSQSEAADARVQATVRVFENYGIFSQPVEPLFLNPAQKEASVAALGALLLRSPEIELILCADPALAALLPDALQSAGANIPFACYGSAPGLLENGLLAASVYDEEGAVQILTALTYNVSRKISPTDGTDIRLNEAGCTNAGFYLQKADTVTGEKND